MAFIAFWVFISVLNFISGVFFRKVCTLLAHLSRRLIGELIVYEGIRRPSTFSNDISSEAMRPILFIFYI